MSAAATPLPTAPAPEAGAAYRNLITGFARTLHANGFAVGLAQTRDALTAASRLNPASAREMEPILRAIFCSRRAEWDKFSDIFAAYWRVSFAQGEVRAAGAPKRDTRPPAPAPADRDAKQQEQKLGAQADAPAPPATSSESARSAAEARELLAEADLRHIKSADDTAALDELAQRLAQRMNVRLMRRFRAANVGTRPDLRRVLRKSIAHGGIPLELVRRRRRRRQPRIAFLLDASGSMDPYAAFFVRFARALCGAFRNMSGYVFHTNLVCISSALRDRDPSRAVDRMTLLAQGWGGGTRIADCLREFNTGHARQALGSRSAAIIVSDGFDTCEPEALVAQMRILRRHARRVFWLNPMLGWTGYEPTAQAMSAALEHVDLFAPAHNLASLMRLEHEFARL